MNIISMNFICFVAVVVTGYYIIPGKVQWIWLLIASYVFYTMAGVQFLFYILFTTVSTFLCGRWISKMEERFRIETDNLQGTEKAKTKKEIKAVYTKKKRKVLALALVSNLGMLCFVKYVDFVIQNINGILGWAGKTEKIDFLYIALPLGISFYVFQSLGYLIDVYRGKIKADTNLFQFALFISFFPQIIQGPIGRYHQLANQLYQAHAFQYRKAKFGVQRMVWGYLKKLVIADRIAVVVDEVFANYVSVGYEGIIIFIAVFLYGIQIYADFSGGMDIVCGVSEVLGIQLTENFRQPYFSHSVAEFWQRWHITLGAWMKDYLFYPLALSKPFNRMSKMLRKYSGNYIAKILPTCLASFIVFVLIGVWHGASWKYVVYGLYQATFVSTATLLGPFYKKCREIFHIQPDRLDFRLFQMLRTIFIVTIGRYLSRAASFVTAWNMLWCTVKTFNPWVLFDESLYTLGLERKNFQFMVVMIILLFAVDAVHEKGIHLREQIEKQSMATRWIIYFTAIFTIIIFGMYGQEFQAQSFIYQGF